MEIILLTATTGVEFRHTVDPAMDKIAETTGLVNGTWLLQKN